MNPVIVTHKFLGSTETKNVEAGSDTAKNNAEETGGLWRLLHRCGGADGGGQAC